MVAITHVCIARATQIAATLQFHTTSVFGIVTSWQQLLVTPQDCGNACGALRNDLLVSGRVLAVLKKLQPDRSSGLRTVLCDNESFIKAKANVRESARQGVQMWHVPPKSPDLNPVEKYWAWLRRRLRKADLDDLRRRKPPLTKKQYKQRVRSICLSSASTAVARNIFHGFRTACQAVLDAGGAATKH